MSRQDHTIEPEELMAYLDGEMPAESALEMASHLEHCEDCQKLAGELQNLSNDLIAWQVEPCETGMPVEIARALKNQRSGGDKMRKLKRGWWNVRIWPKKAWVVAATAATAIVVFVLAIVPSQLQRFSEPAALTQKRDEVVPASPAVSGFSRYSAQGGGGGDASKLAATDKSTYMNLVEPNQSAGRVRAQTLIAEEARNATANGPMIVRKAQLSLAIKDLDRARAGVDGILTQYRGYFSDLKLNTPSGAARSLTATLRVPAQQFDGAMTALKALGRVQSESQQGDEVTQQYVDLEARLKNARNTELRLIEIQRDRTGRLSDVLEVEQEISRVREEIEEMEAERKSMKDRVALATLSLTLTEDYKAELNAVPASTGMQIRNAAVEGYRSLVDGLLSVLLWLLSAGPTLLVWLAILFFPVRFAWRKLRPRLARSKTEPASL